MTHKERFARTLKCERIGGQVPHFELEYYLTMEKFGKVHPQHRIYGQWNQMSYAEQKLHINDIADTYISIAKTYDHSALHVSVNPRTPENIKWLFETIREKTNDEYFLLLYSDPTWAIPNGDTMMDFAVQMMEEPEKLNEISKKNTDEAILLAQKLKEIGAPVDGFLMGSDYCFNVNPFFTPEQFGELIAPYLKEVMAEWRKLGFYSIKHTDGNIMPILKQMADCEPDAIHSLDPQGGVKLREVREIVGPEICLIGNVNCGLLQTGTEEECDADVRRTLREGMQDERGYIFASSNCVYTGLPLERYERMWNIWKKEGIYSF